MISRVRVEARAATMAQAEIEIDILLNHLRLAGYLEGICPQSSEVTDNHFSRVSLGRKFNDPPEEWCELGQDILGRVVMAFTPEVVEGGLSQSGEFEVTEVQDYTPHGLFGHEGSETKPIRREVSDEVMVLRRALPVTRGQGIGPTISDGSRPRDTAGLNPPGPPAA